MQDNMPDTLNLAYNPDAEPVWICDHEGELVFFCIVEDGQVKEWVWL
jgi:hypothetical protein